MEQAHALVELVGGILLLEDLLDLLRTNPIAGCDCFASVGVNPAVLLVWGEPSRWATGGHHIRCHPYRDTQLARCQ